MVSILVNIKLESSIMSHWAAGLFATGLEAINKGKSRNQGAFASAFASVVRYPVKMIAAFLVAPFLAIRLAFIAKNPIRKWIASVGFVLAVFLAWGAGTFLGSLAGALVVAQWLGWGWGLGFLIGTSMSVALSTVFSILVFNATSWLFLQLSSEETIDYLKSISE